MWLRTYLGCLLANVHEKKSAGYPGSASTEQREPGLPDAGSPRSAPDALAVPMQPDLAQLLHGTAPLSVGGPVADLDWVRLPVRLLAPEGAAATRAADGVGQGASVLSTYPCS
jgi:hypothetical protein